MPCIGHSHESPVQRDAQLNERRKYLKSGGLALVSAVAEHVVAYAFGSESLHADAWHQLTDSLQSFFNYFVVTLVIMHPAWRDYFRKGGGYFQGIFMLIAAALILVQMEAIGVRPTHEYFAIMVAAAIATYLGWRRYKILHTGNPWDIVRLFARALQEKEGRPITYLTEIIHVFLDIFVSVIAFLAGLAGWLGYPAADEVIPYVIFGLLLIGGVATLWLTWLHRDSESQGCTGH